MKAMISQHYVRLLANPKYIQIDFLNVITIRIICSAVRQVKDWAGFVIG